MSLTIQILSADLHNSDHSAAVLSLLTEYATDIMGGGEDLSQDVKRELIEKLRNLPNCVVLLAYEGDKPVALSISFESFSTFYAMPLLNIHDFVVVSSHRGKGIARLMLDRLEEIALMKGCCKLTLEVLEGNKRAQEVYTAFGFAPYELDENMGKAMFWHKKLV